MMPTANRPIAAANFYTAELNRLGKLAESYAEAAWRELQRFKPPANDPELVAKQQRAVAYISSQRAAAANDGKCELVEAAAIFAKPSASTQPTR